MCIRDRDKLGCDGQGDQCCHKTSCRIIIEQQPAEDKDWSGTDVNEFSAEMTANPMFLSRKIIDPQPDKCCSKSDNCSDQIIVEHIITTKFKNPLDRRMRVEIYLYFP